MGCLIYIFLLPIYSFIIVCSIIYYFIYSFINIIIYTFYKIKTFFTKKDYNYNKPNFKFEKVIITNKNNIKKDKYKKGKIIDVKIDED